MTQHPLRMLVLAVGSLIVMQLANVLALCGLQWLSNYKNFVW